jgi:hypothetical protein
MTMLPFHRRLLVTALLLVVAAGLIYYVLLRPLNKANQELRNQHQATSAELRKRGLPLNPPQLRALRTERNQQGADLQQRLEAVHDKAMSQFREQLAVYESVQGFRKSITQLDYQEKFTAIRRELVNRDIHLHESVLGLSESSTSPATYQLIVHLWLVRDLALLAKEHNLDLRDYTFQYPEPTDPTAPRQERRPPARISVEPVRSYVVSDKEPPFLEEYPVRLTVTGKVSDLTNLLTALTSGGRYLPLETVSIKKIDVNDPRSERVEATLVCSGFLLLLDKKDFRVNVDASALGRKLLPGRGI